MRKKINWKVRVRNPWFLLQMGAAVFTPILAYMGLTVQDLTTWNKLLQVLLEAARNPYILGLIAVSLFNTIQDPTTAGLTDSEQSMTYEKPKK